MDNLNNWDNLLLRAQQGNSEAKNRLCEKVKVRLRPILKCRLQGWSVEDHQDIMHDTLIVFLEKLEEIKSNPHHYAFKIMRNKIGNALQKRQKAVDIPIQTDEEDDPKNPDRPVGIVLSTGETENNFIDKLDRKITVENILQVIAQLGDFCRLFFMGMLEGKSLNDIWQLWKVTEPDLKRSAFDKRTFDCRKKLRHFLDVGN